VSFKNLSAPRKVNDLAAEVTSGAVLHNPGQVAMATSDPVKIGVFPFASSSSKVLGASVDAADAVAFLSRDVALVKSGDTVWALLDIIHKAKIEEVARDVKALAARPSGESALVLGWDGSATALTLAKYDVESRQFVVRGTLRSIDVSETETYVVADAGGAGSSAFIRAQRPSRARARARICRSRPSR